MTKRRRVCSSEHGAGITTKPIIVLTAHARQTGLNPDLRPPEDGISGTAI
jgi:hypothetical protein